MVPLPVPEKYKVILGKRVYLYQISIGFQKKFILYGSRFISCPLFEPPDAFSPHS
jgi:hypothetical protein